VNCFFYQWFSIQLTGIRSDERTSAASDHVSNRCCDTAGHRRPSMYISGSGFVKRHHRIFVAGKTGVGLASPVPTLSGSALTRCATGRAVQSGEG
jgi:hypothetical protein